MGIFFIGKMKKRKKIKQEKKAKLDASKFGIAGGIITAICFFLVTIAGVIWSGYASHSTWMLVEIYGFLGYSVSVFGAILGAIYGFVDGFILSGVFAWIYNNLL